jgi:putative membrane protein
MNFLLRWLINAIALALAVRFVPGLSLEGTGWTVLVLMAAVFGLVNALIRPLVRLVTLPLTVATFGLFSVVINAAMLWLAAWITERLFPDSRFVIDGLIPALVGAIVVSIVSAVLSSLLIDDEDGK